MDLDEDNEQNRKDFNNIKIQFFGAAKFTCQKCKDLCASFTQMQEHMLEDRCCKYCDQTFAIRTQKLSRKKYICKQYEITFCQGVELHIHKKIYIYFFYMENATAKVARHVPVPCREKSKPTPFLDCQALHYRCTECCHQGEKEVNVFNQIKNKNKAI